MTFLLLLPLLPAPTAAAIKTAPGPIGRMEIVSLTDFAGNAGKLAEKIAPELQALPFLGIIALTLNPEYQALDFSAPLSLFIYAQDAQFLWCAAVGINKGQKLPPSVKLFGREAFVKKIGGRIGLSYSSPLLNSITALPPLLAPAKDDNLASILLVLDVAKYLDGCPGDYHEFKSKYLDGALLKNLERNHGNAATERAKQTAEEVEKLLRQLSKMTVRLNVLPEQIEMKITAEPAPGSDLLEFISRQSENKIQLPPVMKNKAVAASVDVEAAPDMVRRLPGMLFEFQNDQQLPTDAKSLLAVIAASIDSRFSYYADLENGKPVFFLKTESRTEKISFLKKTLDINGVKPLAEETFRIKEYAPGKYPAVYCRLYYDSIAVVSGDITAARAMELFKESESPEHCQSLEKRDTPIQILLRHSNESQPSAITVDMNGGRLNIVARASPLLLRKFIPAALLAKSKTAAPSALTD